MNLSVTPISNVNYGIKSIKSNKTENLQTAPSAQAPSFKGTKLRNITMFVLAAIAAFSLPFFNSGKGSPNNNKADVEEVDERVGIVRDTFPMNVPEAKVLDDRKILEKDGFTVIETPDAKVIRRDTSDSYEITAYYPNGDYSYEFADGSERIFEYYRGGELIFWDNFPNPNYLNNEERNGCKKFVELDEFGNVEQIYYVSKSGQVTTEDEATDLQ